MEKIKIKKDICNIDFKDLEGPVNNAIEHLKKIKLDAMIMGYKNIEIEYYSDYDFEALNLVGEILETDKELEQRKKKIQQTREKINKKIEREREKRVESEEKERALYEELKSKYEERLKDYEDKN